MSIFQNINAKSVARTVFLPGFVPRTRELFGSGFSWLATLMASLYAGVRLLPPDHPYLRTENQGKFGIRHVIAAAAQNLRFKKDNIDQIAVFAAVLIGLVVLVMQFVLVIALFVFRSAHAGPPAGLFTTPDPDTDVAFMMLDSVFGIPGIFGSSLAPAAAANISSFHNGLHGLLQFYSTAMLIVAGIILVYYIMVVVAETAQTGTPFGKRFNHIWAPIRLVVALGLLVPINYGLNSAQYITLYTAKLGSGFATHAWLQYINVISSTPAANNATGRPNSSLIARPTAPQFDHIMQFMTLVQTCKAAYETLYGLSGPESRNINAYLVKRPRVSQLVVDDGGINAGVDWVTARTFYENQDIVIRFGHDGKDATDPANDKYPAEPGGIEPTCGEIVVHVKDLTIDPVIEVQWDYFEKITLMFGAQTEYDEFAKRYVCARLNRYQSNKNTPGCAAGDDVLPDAAWRNDLAAVEQIYIQNIVDAAFDDMDADPTLFEVTLDISERGWGGAGIWYNRIAQWNGALFGAIAAVPTPTHMPLVMETVEKDRRGNNESTDPLNRYTPRLSDGKTLASNAKDQAIAEILNNVYQDWRSGNTTAQSSTRANGNVIYGVLGAVFGFNGLYEMRHGDNINANPMAQLSGMGKSVIDTAIRNLMGGIFASAGGGLIEQLGFGMGKLFTTLGSLFVTFSTMTLTIGFILYYILPTLPFIYFFFAVSAWVKTIFEAMVGVPLWALAHLKIDGTGLPANAAMNGYFLIFEIFVRPILTVFGLVSSMTIFTALVKTLNGIFTLATSNLTGFNCSGCGTANVPILLDLEFKRGVIDEFFFTVVYVILVYLMAMSSFRLIDTVPSKVLRWMGSSAGSFADTAGDPKEGMVQWAAISAQGITQSLAGQARGAAYQVGGAAGKGISELTKLGGESVKATGGKAP